MACWISLSLFWISAIQVTISANAFGQHSTHIEHRSSHFTVPKRLSMNQDSKISAQSVTFTKAVQKVQDQERKRLDTRIEKPAPKTENESFKIVNYVKPNIENRQGQADETYRRVGDSVVFPGQMPNVSKAKFKPLVPDHCAKNGICEDIPDYPEEHVEQLLNKIGDDRSRFKIDELEAPEIAQRIGSPEETELCYFRERIVYPKAAPDKDGHWYYIMNQHNVNLQGVRVEICEPNTECHKIAFFPLDYKGYCKQKFALRQLSAVDENGRIIEHSFKLPSCCSCVVKDGNQ